MPIFLYAQHAPCSYLNRKLVLALAGIVVLALGASGASAGEPAASVKAVAGVLLTRQGDGGWDLLHAKDPVPFGKLVVAMPRSELVSANGAVELRLLADVARRGPLPVLEAGVKLYAAKDVDLDIAFERGLIVLVNLKKEGEAKVRLRIRDETWVLTLHDPGTKVGLEYYSRLYPGIAKDVHNVSDPIGEVIGLVLHGEAFLDLGKQGVGMRAPPGPAMLHWDTHSRKLNLRRLEKLPEVLMKPLDDKEDKDFKAIAALAQGLEKKKLAAWLHKLALAEGTVGQLVGVTLAGALDNLPQVMEVLETSKHAEVRNHAIIVMRHWLGREPGQVQKLFGKLVDERKLTEVQARSALQLLIGFDEDEKDRPETYEMLIGYLKHSKQAVRELAHWHLVRLAPAGNNIPFDAGAPEAARLKAYEQWRELIPDGQLPPLPAPAKVDKK